MRAWETSRFSSLARKVGQGRKPILTVTNALHTDVLDKAVEAHRQDVKAIQAELIQSLEVPMSTDTVKRFLKKLLFMATHPAVYAPSAKQSRVRR